MKPEIEAEYKDALRSMMAHGYPVAEEESIYSDTDSEANAHLYLDRCSWVIPAGSKVKEVQRYEFTDTFHSNELVTLLEMEDLSCRCGVLKNHKVRYRATLEEVLNTVLGNRTNEETL